MKNLCDLFLIELDEKEQVQISGGGDGGSVMFKFGRWLKGIFCDCGSGGNSYDPDFSVLRGDKTL